MWRPVLLLALLAAAAGTATPQARAQTQPLVALPGAAGRPTVACGPGDASPACRDIRRALRAPEANAATAPFRGQQPPAPSGGGDVRGARYIPPPIEAFLNDRRIDPVLRAYLRSMAAKPTEDWTLADLQTVSAVVPTLTEMRYPIPTARISEFYEFLGLDPTQLFEPQLGNWQGSSTAFDPRNFAGITPECPSGFQRRRTDPADVRLKDLANCPQGGFGQLR